MFGVIAVRAGSMLISKNVGSKLDSENQVRNPDMPSSSVLATKMGGLGANMAFLLEQA